MNIDLLDGITETEKDVVQQFRTWFEDNQPAMRKGSLTPTAG